MCDAGIGLEPVIERMVAGWCIYILTVEGYGQNARLVDRSKLAVYWVLLVCVCV